MRTNIYPSNVHHTQSLTNPKINCESRPNPAVSNAAREIKTNIRSIEFNGASLMTKKLQPDKRVADLVQPAGECGGMSKKSADKALRVDDLIMHYAFQLALITAICFFYFQSTEGIVQLNK